MNLNFVVAVISLTESCHSIVVRECKEDALIIDFSIYLDEFKEVSLALPRESILKTIRAYDSCFNTPELFNVKKILYCSFVKSFVDHSEMVLLQKERKKLLVTYSDRAINLPASKLYPRVKNNFEYYKAILMLLSGYEIYEDRMIQSFSVKTPSKAVRRLSGNQCSCGASDLTDCDHKLLVRFYSKKRSDFYNAKRQDVRIQNLKQNLEKFVGVQTHSLLEVGFYSEEH